ncbi:MAG TPA: DUF4129 domain-containing protein [Gemmataceae bacterium]|nr:DUF4129 domain-containing protein [Gemmataceae bacterium]
MIGKHLWPLFTGLVALICLPFLVHAQEGGGYKHFTIDKDYEEILAKRFEANRQLGPLKDLVKKMLANPDQLPFDPEKFKDVKLEDENLKKLVQEWVANDPSVRKSLRDWLDKNPINTKQPPDIKKLQTELNNIVEEAQKAKPSADQAAPPHFPAAIDGPDHDGDSLAKMAERALKQTERSRLGQWLRESPAWKRAFDDLHGTATDPTAPRWKLEGWQARLLDQDGAFWKVGEKTLGQLRNLPRPDMESFNLSTPGVSNVPLPNFGGSSMPSFSIGNTLTWVLTACLCLLIGWSVLRFRRRSATAQAPRPDLGPWPMRPEAVGTRADLIRAFDYLALWTLGLSVKSWNHHAVARSWGDKSPACAVSASTLARLYEQARYTDGVDLLSDEERERARQALAQIAEAL